MSVFLALLSAALTAIAIPNEFFLLGVPVAGLVALAPLYIALRTTRSWRQSALLCALQTGLVHVLSSWWLGNFHGLGIYTLGASAIGTAFIGLAFGMYQHTCLRIEHHLLPKPLSFAMLWVIYETAKSSSFFGYPWGTIYMASYRWHLLTQTADISGVYGISFLLALASAVIGEGILLTGMPPCKNPMRHYAAYICSAHVLLGLCALAVAHGTLEFLRRPAPQKQLNAVVVQQNIDPWEAPGDEFTIELSQRLTEDGIFEFHRQGIRPDIVVWTEGVLRRAFPSAYKRYSTIPADEPLTHFIARTGVPFIIGAPFTLDPFTRRNGNSAILFDKTGAVEGWYTKMHLVPMAEAVPFSDIDPVFLFMTSRGMFTGWTRGTRHAAFEIPLDSRTEPQNTITFSIPICFEDAFPSSCAPLWFAGSEVFINITNDSWSKTKSAEYQHFVIASFRCIEYRTPMLRACNSGYTAVIMPNGLVLTDIPPFTQTHLCAQIPIYARRLTLYAAYGDWLPCLCIAVMLLFVLWQRFRNPSQTQR